MVHMETKILLADDHTIIREGMRSLFENRRDMKVVGEASSGIEIHQKVPILKPDFIMMDISMPDLNGMAATRLIKGEWPNIHIIGLSVYHQRQYISGILEAGAEGYLVKNNAFKEVVQAIQIVQKGYIALGRQARRVVFKDFARILAKDKTKMTLSQEEQAVVQYFDSNKSISQLADELNIDENHLESLKTRLIRNWVGCC